MTAEPRKIFVVFKTHFDIGFTGLVDEVLDSYARVMFPRAVRDFRQSRLDNPGTRAAWTVPAWPLSHSLEMLRGTSAGADLEQAAADGILTWHALPFTLHTELFGLEDLIRSLSVGRALRERFGRTAVSAKMTDVPGHTWILPTILANAGVRFLHLGCNACSTPPDVPLLFHWEGPDGSRLITLYSRGGYGSPLFPPPGWTLPVWLSLQHTQDNAGPQGPDAAGRILAEVHARSPRHGSRIREPGRFRARNRRPCPRPSRCPQGPRGFMDSRNCLDAEGGGDPPRRAESSRAGGKRNDHSCPVG